MTRKGMTLVEVMVAVAVLALGLLSLLGALAFGLRASESGARHAEATQHAKRYLALIRQRNLAFAVEDPLPGVSSGLMDGSSVRRALNAAPFASDFPPNLSFRRRLVLSWAYPVGDPRHGRLARLESTVFWSDRGVERSVQLVGYAKKP